MVEHSSYFSVRTCSPFGDHQRWFESDRACLGHNRPSCTGSWLSCTKLTSIGSSIYCIGNGGSYHSSTSDHWLEGWDGGMRPSSKHVVVSFDTNFESWMSLSDSKLTFCKWNDNLICIRNRLFNLQGGGRVFFFCFVQNFFFGPKRPPTTRQSWK
jgi:hypothetical protein